MSSHDLFWLFASHGRGNGTAKNDRITERGSHASLLAATQADGHPGWYATQWRVQQLEASLAITDAADPGVAHQAAHQAAKHAR